MLNIFQTHSTISFKRVAFCGVHSWILTLPQPITHRVRFTMSNQFRLAERYIGITTAGFAAFAFPLHSVIGSLSVAAQYSRTWKSNIHKVPSQCNPKVMLLVQGS